MFRIRTATQTDGPAAITTLHRSIAELCIADHRGNPSEIAAWLANKTPEAWANWLKRDDAILLVAESHSPPPATKTETNPDPDPDRRIIAVGMATRQGEILLNYIDSDARFQGVSKAMLATLERHLRSLNIPRCTLETTLTARAFYNAQGYRKDPSHTALLSKRL